MRNSTGSPLFFRPPSVIPPFSLQVASFGAGCTMSGLGQFGIRRGLMRMLTSSRLLTTMLLSANAAFGRGRALLQTDLNTTSPAVSVCGAEVSSGLTVASGASLSVDTSCSYGSESWNSAGITSTYTTSALANGAVDVQSGGLLVLDSVTGSANAFSINGSLTLLGAMEVRGRRAGCVLRRPEGGPLRSLVTPTGIRRVRGSLSAERLPWSPAPCAVTAVYFLSFNHAPCALLQFFDVGRDGPVSGHGAGACGGDMLETSPFDTSKASAQTFLIVRLFWVTFRDGGKGRWGMVANVSGCLLPWPGTFWMVVAKRCVW